jgi:hypothetical protein
MSTKQISPVQIEELSCIPLTDDLDGNDNRVTKRDVHESSAECLDIDRRERSQPPNGHGSSMLVHQASCDSDVFSSKNSPDKPKYLNSNEIPPRRRSSAFDDLLFEIYDRWHYGWRGGEALESDTYTDLTAESDAFVGRSGDSELHGDGVDGEKGFRYSRPVIESKGKKLCILLNLINSRRMTFSRYLVCLSGTLYTKIKHHLIGSTQ